MTGSRKSMATVLWWMSIEVEEVKRIAWKGRGLTFVYLLFARFKIFFFLKFKQKFHPLSLKILENSWNSITCSHTPIVHHPLMRKHTHRKIKMKFSLLCVVKFFYCTLVVIKVMSLPYALTFAKKYKEYKNVNKR